MGKSRKSARVAREHQDSASPEADTAAASLITTRKARKESAPKPAREERNGVKRPGPGKCLEVWEYLDQHGDMQAKDLKAVALDKGWNVSNTLIEFYRHRKFVGITRATTN
jgi:hypothetical protein